MQPARTRKSRLKCGVKNVFSLTQQSTNMLKGQALQKMFRRGPRPGGEKAMKVELAHSSDLRQGRETGLCGAVFIQVADDAGNALVIVHEMILRRNATLSTRFLRLISAETRS
jgi:hypothetical protein